MSEVSTAVTEVAKVSPPLLVTGTHFFGITWEQWVYILTAIYTFIQICDYLYTKYKKHKEDKLGHTEQERSD